MAGLLERVNVSKSRYDTNQRQAFLELKNPVDATDVYLEGLQGTHCRQCHKGYNCQMEAAQGEIRIKMERATYYVWCPIINTLKLNRP